MIWHLVRLDFSGVDDATRGDLERQLAELARLDVVGFLRIGRDLDQPDVTGLVTGFASEADLDAYRVHPDHVPVVDAIHAAGVATSRFDIATDDHVQELPA